MLVDRADDFDGAGGTAGHHQPAQEVANGEEDGAHEQADSCECAVRSHAGNGPRTPRTAAPAMRVNRLRPKADARSPSAAYDPFVVGVRVGLPRRAGATVRRWHGTDGVLALLLLVVALGSVVVDEPAEGPLVLTLPVAVAFCGAVLLRSRMPLVSVALVTVAGVAQAFWGVSPGSLWAFAALLLVAVALGQQLSEVWAGAGLAVLVAGLWLQEWRDGGEDYLFILLVFGGAWLLGRGLRAWQQRATSAEQHQRDLARLAVAEERVRIARELHDVVAHGLSVIAVQADAAEAALARDPGRAGAPLRAISASAREALADMRQMLTLLRSDSEDPVAPRGLAGMHAEVMDRTPARGIADLPDLVEATRGTGLDVESTIDVGAQPELSPGLQLAVYRIAQEGLTNIVKHAGAVPATLSVFRRDGVVLVRVENGPPSKPPRHLLRRQSPVSPSIGSTGHGLVGIRERAHALGGTARAHSTADGGFVVTAELPVVAGP